MPGPQKPFGLGYVKAHECLLALVDDMRGRDEHTGALLEHIDNQTLGESFGRSVEVAYHHVAPLPPHQADGVRVHQLHEEIHATPPCTEGLRAYV